MITLAIIASLMHELLSLTLVEELQLLRDAKKLNLSKEATRAMLPENQRSIIGLWAFLGLAYFFFTLYGVVVFEGTPFFVCLGILVLSMTGMLKRHVKPFYAKAWGMTDSIICIALLVWLTRLI